MTLFIVVTFMVLKYLPVDKLLTKMLRQSSGCSTYHAHNPYFQTSLSLGRKLYFTATTKKLPKLIPLKQSKLTNQSELKFGYSVLLAQQGKEEYHNICIYFSVLFATNFCVIDSITLLNQFLTTSEYPILPGGSLFLK